MAEPEKLTIRDAENAQKGILALALAYPDYPKLFKADNTTIRWNSIKADRSIGLFPIQGAVYLKKSIEAQEMLNNLAAWMEESGIEFKDPHLALQSITRTSPVYGGEQDEKTVVYAINIQLKYFYKK